MCKVNRPTSIRSQPWPHRYVSRGWHLVPVIPGTKQPYISNFRERATCNHDKIARWLKCWPNADWMVVTGLISRLVVLDVDFRPEGNGRNTLEFDLEIGFLPGAPVAHSPRWVSRLLRGAGSRGRDIRRQARLVPRHRRRPRPDHLAAGPGALLGPASPLRSEAAADAGVDASPHATGRAERQITSVGELDGYCEAALRSAWAAIIEAPPGERHVTLLREVFAIAGLVDDYGMPASVALRTLEQAGLKQPRRKPRPSTKEVLKTVKDAFDAGLRISAEETR